MLIVALVLALATLPLAGGQDGTGEDDAQTVQETDEGVILPVPRSETEVMPLDAQVGTGPRVVFEWPVQPDAERYEVYVNPGTDAPRPVWQLVEEVAQPETDGEDGNVTVAFQSEDVPEPASGRSTVSYAVVALAEDGTVISQARVAVDTERSLVTPEGYTPFAPSEEEEVADASMTGALIGLGALVAIAVAVLVVIGLRARQHD